MSYQVIARKFRPQSFGDLIGQDHITQTLLNALRSGRLPHALLFTGPRGTGKTSSARILAKSLRCTKSKDYVPCEVCADCLDISIGRSLDVIEIDGASNNGVEAIRELRDTVGYMPSSGKNKVYIIDEVHMLSTNAFNALLKTLEEPPSHVTFIMATTEVQKIPNTILSRCQRFDFRSISARQIAERLAYICKQEDVKFEKEALFTIARHSGGSMRDSQSLLDQVITYCQKTITQAQVVEILGLTDRSVLYDALHAILTQSPRGLVEVLEKLKKSGVEPKNFAQDLLEHIRNFLVLKVAGDQATTLIDASDTEIKRWQDLIECVSEGDLHIMFDMILKGVQELLRSPDSQLTLDVLILRWGSAPRLKNILNLLSSAGETASLNGISSQSQGHETKVTHSPTTAAQSSANQSKQMQQDLSQPYIQTRVQENTIPNTTPSLTPNSTPASIPNSTPASVSTVTSAANSASKTPLTPKASAEFSNETSQKTLESPLVLESDPWSLFVVQVQKANGFLGALLENTRVARESKTEIVLEMPDRMKFLLDKLQDPENIRRTETFIRTFWNKDLKVLVELGSDSPTLTPKEAASKAEEKKKESDLEIIERHPLVMAAKQIFKAEIVSIKESE